MQLEEKYAFDSQGSFPPSSWFPAQALCEASGETGFCEEEPHMQSRPLRTRRHPSHRSHVDNRFGCVARAMVLERRAHPR